MLCLCCTRGKTVVHSDVLKLLNQYTVLHRGNMTVCLALPDTWLITWFLPCRGQGGGPHRPAQAA